MTRSLMEATKTRFFAHEGVVTDERDVEDNSARLGATRLAAELAGVLTSVGAGQHHGPTTIIIGIPDWGVAPGTRRRELVVTESAPVY